MRLFCLIKIAITAIFYIAPSTTLDGSTSQAEKAGPKIQYKIHKENTRSKVYKNDNNINITVKIWLVF